MELSFSLFSKATREESSNLRGRAELPSQKQALPTGEVLTRGVFFRFVVFMLEERSVFAVCLVTWRV